VELLVPALQEIDLGEEQLGVKVHVQLSVQLPQASVHLGSSLLGELAVEHDDCAFRHQVLDCEGVPEEEVFQLLGSVEVDGSVDVSPVELVLKSAVDNQEGRV
jgi:hypothetical protein